MYGLSYLTQRNGSEFVQLNWIDGRPNKLLRKGRRLAKDGAQDVCLETPDGRSLRINRAGQLTTTDA